MGVHSLIPDEGRAESLWHVGISFKDRPTSSDVTRVVRLKSAPRVGMRLVVPTRDRSSTQRVEIINVRNLISHRFDALAQVRPASASSTQG